MNNVSLFTGSGIGDYAAAQHGIITVAQCEIDPACMYCLERLFPNSVKFKDVRDVSARSFRERGIGQVDIISGGFPCQDLSTAGRGAGIEGGRSGLWREMFRIIRQVRPTWLVIENVPVIRVRGVDRVLAPLERIGYTCWPLVVHPEAVTSATSGERLWLVATSNCGRFKIQYPRSRPSLLESERRCAKLSQGVGVLRRPSPPGGYRQHEWEAPRLAQFGLGDAIDGLAGRIRSRANKTLLRMVGNGWCYPIPWLIYQWIAEHGEGQEVNNNPSWEEGFIRLWRSLFPRLSEPVREYRFHPSRKWRFDFAWPDVMLAVEIEGGAFGGGRHQRWAGFNADAEKYREAVKAGWRVMRYTGDDMRRRPVQCVEEVAKILEAL